MLPELQKAPGIGPRIAADLKGLGVTSLASLAIQDPDKLYLRLCRRRGERIDPCVLYVFRCGVYFASRQRHKPELLKWWNWKDRRLTPLK